MLVRTSKNKENPYVIIHKKFLEDKRLSLQAKGMLCYCMSKPDGWDFYIEQMASVLKESKYVLYKIFNELIKYGYCERKPLRTDRGKFLKLEYILFEVPKPQQPDGEKTPSPFLKNSGLDESSSVNSPLVSNDKQVKKDLSNTCANSVDAKKSRKPFAKEEKKPKVEKPDNPKIQRRELVFISHDDHEKLLKKFGQVTTDQCYDHLNDWKASKREADPKAVDKHTDYYRIVKWVCKEIKESESRKQVDDTREWAKINRDLFFMIKQKYPNEMKPVEYASGFIINKNTCKDVSVNLKPELFKNILGTVIGADIHD